MAAESILVTKSDGTTDLTFYRISQQGTTSRFALSSNTLSERVFIDVEQKLALPNSNASDIKSVTVRREELDSDNQLIVSKVKLEVTIPKSSTITLADIGNDATCLMCLFHKNFLDILLSASVVASGDYHVDGAYVPARV